MKKFTLIFILTGIITSASFSQDTKFYGSGGSEMIFSFAKIDNQGNDNGNVMRWAPVLNIQGYANVDFANIFGLFGGLSVKNIGFIYDEPNTNIKWKYRTYNLGIPVGIKIGKLDFMFIFAGYEIEFPFAYKEKKFENEIKDKFTVWFSDRVEPVQHSLMAGIQFPYGMDIKFKYYLTNFHNKNYVEVVDNVSSMPYENLNSNIFYFSIAWNLFSNPKAYQKSHATKEKVIR